MMNKCKFGNVKKIKDGNIIAKNINVNSIFFGEPHAPIEENKAKHIIQKIGHALQVSSKGSLPSKSNLLLTFTTSQSADKRKFINSTET